MSLTRSETSNTPGYSHLEARATCAFSKGSNFDNVKWAIIGPQTKRHLNDVSLAGQWWPNIKCWLGSFVVLQGIRTSIAKEHYVFEIFQGGSGPPCPPLGPRMYDIYQYSWSPLVIKCSHQKSDHTMLKGYLVKLVGLDKICAVQSSQPLWQGF